MFPIVFVCYRSHLDNELLSANLSIFKVLQGFSDPSQPAFPQFDIHRLKQARFEELGEFLGELIDVVIVVFGGRDDVSKDFEGLVEYRVEQHDWKCRDRG